MNFYKANLFASWVLLPHVVAMGWIAAVGRMALELAGVTTFEGDIPGRLVGLLLVLGAVVLLQHYRGGLSPMGNVAGTGFHWGFRLVFWANVLALSLFCFEFIKPFMTSYNLALVISHFTEAFGYWVLAMWAIGFSLIYQSALPQTLKTPS
jgi:predicted membrane protein